MSSANKQPNKSSANRTAGTQRRTTASSSASGSGSRNRSRRNAKKVPLLTVIKSSSAGRFLLIILGTLCVLGLDFLFSLNQFDRFFLLLGIELIAAVLIGWIRFVLHGRSDDNN